MQLSYDDYLDLNKLVVLGVVIKKERDPGPIRQEFYRASHTVVCDLEYTPDKGDLGV